MKNLKTRIAAGATVVGLAGLAGVALSSSKQAAVATKPLVRTKVIHRTVHVTKHAKPKHPAAAGPGSQAGASSGYGGSSAPVATGSSSTGASEATYSEPVTTTTSGSAPAAAPESSPVVTHTSGSPGSTGGSGAPVTTATSGAGAGGGGEGEHEGGGDD